MGQPENSSRYFPYTGSLLFDVYGTATVELRPSVGDRFYWFMTTVAVSGSSEENMWNPITDVVEVNGVKYLDGVDYYADVYGFGVWNLYDVNQFGVDPYSRIEYPTPDTSLTMTGTYMPGQNLWQWSDTFNGIPAYSASIKLTPYSNISLISDYAIYLYYAASAVETPTSENELEIGVGKISLTSGVMMMSVMTYNASMPESNPGLVAWAHRARILMNDYINNRNH